MAGETTIGTILINEALPKDMRREQHHLDKKGIHRLFMELAEKHPEQYSDVLRALSEVGKATVWTEGLSVSLADLHRSEAKERVLAPVRKRVRAILDDDRLSDEQRRDAMIGELVKVVGPLQDAVLQESRDRKSPFAIQVDSGARGKKGSLASLKGADLLATDQQDRFIPIPLMHSYAEGFTPAEYFAAGYGQRKGQIDVKLSTADAGFLCLHGDTLVRMADWSAKPIRDITVGEWVLGADMEGNTSPVRVSAVFDHGEQPATTYRFRPGRNRELVSLTATSEHKMLAMRKAGKQSVRQPTRLPLGKAWRGYGVVPASSLGREYWEIGVDVGWMATAVGLLLGDGGLTGNSTMLSSADQQMVGRLNAEWQEVNHRLRKVSRAAEHVEWVLEEIVPSGFMRDEGGRVTPGARDPLRQLLSELGMLGKYAHEKVIPAAVWDWNQYCVAALLGGLLEADGCVTSTNNGTMPVVRLGVTSERLAREVKALLEVRFGVYTTPVAAYGHEKVGQSFSRQIGEKNVTYRHNHPVWTFTVSARQSVERIAELPWPGRKGELLRKLLQEARPAVRDERYMFAFVDKTPAGPCRVYDIEVDHPDHLFVLANGMVSSNSKQLVNAAHRQVVTHGQPLPRRLPTGLPVETADRANIGAVLAYDTKGLKAGHVLTDEDLQDLEDAGIDEILVASPMTEASEDGGVSAWAAGRRTRQGLHLVGDNIGIPAAQAVGEKLSQGALSSKHSAGVQTRISKSGFEYVNRLIQAPQHFPEAGPLAEEGGRVDAVEKAPQGGHYIRIGKKEYYAGPDLEVTVKPGQAIEQGDDLTDGTPHPQDLVRLRGMGEARRVYMRELRQALENSGVDIHRRNLESVVAGLLNWAQVTDPDGVGENIYDDVVPYGRLMATYRPRDDAVEFEPKHAVGRYLEEPVLHYTPGTRVTKKIADHLNKWKVKSIFTHDDPPGFEPHMVRGLLSVYHDPDWKTRLGGFYTARAFERSLHRGLESDRQSTSFLPAITQPTGFGANLQRTGKYAQVAGRCVSCALEDAVAGEGRRMMMGPPGYDHPQHTAHFWVVGPDGEVIDRAADTVPEDYVYEGREVDPAAVARELIEALSAREEQ